MLPDTIANLVREEQEHQHNRLVEGVDLDAYLAKLGDSAEGRCRGFVAFYCNDQATKQAYITLVLVNPRDRGLGIGRTLVACVLALAKRRGFTSCRLQVARHNEVAHAMYVSLGFRVVDDRAEKYLLEIGL
jgi:ribosomal protein S18 acetylase RimI-like enzyme